MASDYSDPNPEYWEDYTNFQRVKHLLIQGYLDGWLPKAGLTKAFSDVLYIDTHAGRGRYAAGQEGSPIVAMRTILDHKALPRILDNVSIRVRFVERDAQSHAALSAELRAFGDLPDRLDVRGIPGNCYGLLERVTKWLGTTKCPAFVFVDPYGFKVPGERIRDLLACRGTEVFVNVIWREVDMAIRQGSDSNLVDRLDTFFGTRDWVHIAGVDNAEERLRLAIVLLGQSYGARWATPFRMVIGRTRYLLLHLTNHPDGRDLMKDVMWKAAPDGTFSASKSVNTRQEVLLTSEPDLRPLEDWLREEARTPRSWESLLESLRDTLWRGPHLTKTIRKLYATGELTTEDGSKPLKSRNSVLRLTQTP